MNCVSLGDNEHFIDFEYEFHAWCYFRHIFWKYQSFTSITFWNDSCRILSFTKNSSEAHIKRIALILITCCFFPFTIRIESNRVNWTDQMLKIKHTQIVFFLCFFLQIRLFFWVVSRFAVTYSFIPLQCVIFLTDIFGLQRTEFFGCKII